MLKKILWLILFILSLTNCVKDENYYRIPAFSDDKYLQAVIEIPAGTNKKFEYNKLKHIFEVDQKNGKDRVVSFLPYLGNYGFVPSTYSDPKEGGDGDALDILVLSESVDTGTVLKVVPIAVLKLIDDGEIDYKIIAVPKDKNKQILKVSNYKEFCEKYPEVKNIIELWFLNYNKEDKASIEGWGDEKEALQEITKNR